MKYTKVDEDTGEVVMLLHLPDEASVDVNQESGFLLLPDHAPNETYYKAGEFVPRPDFNAIINKHEIKADSTDALVISGLPNEPVQCFLSGPVQDLWSDTGELELVFNVPGDYMLRVSRFPYLDLVVKINVKA